MGYQRHLKQMVLRSNAIDTSIFPSNAVAAATPLGAGALVADMSAYSITIAGAANVQPSGFALMCNGTLTIPATASITAPGNFAVGQTGGLVTWDTALTRLLAGLAGADGGNQNAAGAISGDRSSGVYHAMTGFGIGGNGGNGVGGAFGAHGDATVWYRHGVCANNVNPYGGVWYVELEALMGVVGSLCGGGGGGGGGGGTGAGDVGGGGGGGGGVILIIARDIVIGAGAVISAIGGAGGDATNATNNNAGGGGGGGGGTVCIIYQTVTGNLLNAIDVSGGAGGAAGALGGGAGVAGVNGNTILIQIPY